MTKWPLGLIALLFLVGATPTAEVEIVVVEQVEAAADDELSGDASTAILTLIQLPDRTELREIPVPTGEPLVVSLPVGSSWEVSVDWQGHWVPPKVLNIRSARERHTLEAWRVGRVGGEFHWSGSSPLEDGALVVATERLPLGQRSPNAPPPSRFPCTLSVNDGERRGTFECEVPAGTHDLGFYLDDHAPVYRWATPVPVDETATLARLTFVEGASLSGWVTSTAKTLEAGKGVVRLRRRLAPGPSSPTAERLERAVPTTRIDGRGFFQLRGLAAGDYSLEVTYPGLASQTISGIVTRAGDETRLTREIELVPPLDLELSVQPPTDWRGEPWTVEVRREDDEGHRSEEPVHHGAVDAEGRARVAGQSPGPYSVRVLDSTGSVFLIEPQVLVYDQEAARRELFVETVTVAGTLLRGDREVEGTVWFGGRYGVPGVRVETDEDGEFAAVLPRDGRWTVEAETVLPDEERGFGDGGAESLMTELSVRVEDGDRIEVRIPDTYAFGWVVDSESVPVADADVMAFTGTLTARARTGADGAFAIRGLPEGEWSFSASVGSQRDGTAATARQELPVVEGQPLGPVELVLEETVALAGTVRDREGPVAGATVSLFGHVPTLDYVGIARSDAEGRFSLRVPESARQLRALILAPGRGLQAKLVDPTVGALAFYLERWVGSLEVRLDREWRAVYDDQQIVLLFQDGVLIPTGSLAEWGLAQGVEFLRPDGFHVLGMAPGAYELCLGPMGAIEPAALEEWKLRSECVAGELTGGGDLRLDLAAIDQ